MSTRFPHYVLRCNTDSVSVVRFLDLIKPFVPILPEVAAPERKTPFRQRLMWTGVSFFFLIQSASKDGARRLVGLLTSVICEQLTLLIFLVMSQMP